MFDIIIINKVHALQIELFKPSKTCSPLFTYLQYYYGVETLNTIFIVK